MGLSSDNFQSNNFPSPLLNQSGYLGHLTTESSYQNGQDVKSYRRSCMRNNGADRCDMMRIAPGQFHHQQQAWVQETNGLEKRQRRSRGRARIETMSSNCTEATLHRLQANNRERERTQNLNMGFARLSRIVPRLPSDKLCKRQILQLAIRYIAFLTNVIRDEIDVRDFDGHPWTAGSLLTHKKLSNAFCFFRLRTTEGSWTSD